jgi:molecular chaperone DnaK
VKKNKTYTTAVDNQPAVTIHVLQGERPMATDNKALGQFNLDGIPGMRRGEPQIEVTFDIDANGIMHVSAKEKTTGKEQKVTISGATGLSEEEIEKAQTEAAQFAEEDKKKKELIEVKNRCDAMAHQVEKFLEEAKTNEDKAPLDADDKEKMEGFVKQAADLKADGASTKEQYEELMKQIEETLNGMYQKYGGQWNSDAATENPGQEVIEADDEPKSEETK